jgi:hypothetical protein
MQRDEARRLLGVGPGVSPREVERAFRRRVRGVHPDHGGDPRAFHELVSARAALTADHHLGRHRPHGPQSPVRTRLVVRRSAARRLLLAVRARLPHRPAPRVR